MAACNYISKSNAAYYYVLQLFAGLNGGLSPLFQLLQSVSTGSQISRNAFQMQSGKSQPMIRSSAGGGICGKHCSALGAKRLCQ